MLRLLLLFSLTPAVAHSATWVVDSLGFGDFPTLQDAIDGSADGDVIQAVAGS